MGGVKARVHQIILVAARKLRSHGKGFRRGSVSVFAALSVMLTASVLFTFLEGARISEQRRVLQASTDAALESVFAGYDVHMWEQYHLLMRSVGSVSESLGIQEIGEEMREVSANTINPKPSIINSGAKNFLRGELKGVSVNKYLLATDQKGAAYQSAIVAYMKHNLVQTAAKKLKKLYDRQQSMDEVDEDQAVSDAQAAIDTAKKEAAESDSSGGQEQTQGETAGADSNGGQKQAQSSAKDQQLEVDDNPLEALTTLKKKGILTLVLPKNKKISENQVDLSQAVSKRTLEQGNAQIQTKFGWYEKILMQQYYAEYFSDYRNPNKRGGFQYEREYLLGGKSSDMANLKSCVNKLLAIREAANFAAAVADGAKFGQAQSLATALAGFTVNPVIIEGVAFGILAAWAFVESILDLRALLDGKRIALVKTADQWTSDVLHLSKCASADFQAQECKGGLSYTDYLNMLLYTKGSTKMAYRAMDVQESAMRKNEGYENFRMDHMLLEASVSAEYEFSQNFLSPVVVKKLGGSRFSVSCESSYSYMKAGE